MRDKRASEFESSFLELLSFASSDLTSRSRNLQASSGRSFGAVWQQASHSPRRRCAGVSPSPGADVAAKGSRAKCNVQHATLRDATPELTGTRRDRLTLEAPSEMPATAKCVLPSSVDRHASCASRACARTPYERGVMNLGECRTIIICAVVGLVRKVLAAWTPSKRRCRASADMCGVFPAEGTHGYSWVLMGTQQGLMGYSSCTSCTNSLNSACHHGAPGSR